MASERRILVLDGNRALINHYIDNVQPNFPYRNEPGRRGLPVLAWSAGGDSTRGTGKVTRSYPGFDMLSEGRSWEDIDNLYLVFKGQESKMERELKEIATSGTLSGEKYETGGKLLLGEAAA